MPRIQTLSPATLAEQQQMLRWWRQSPRGGRTGEVQGDRTPNERHIRWARTTTDASYPTYPAGTKVIACELGEYTFDDSAVADVAGTFTAYSPAEIRYAYFQFGWRPKSSIVRLTLHGGKWFCLDENGILDAAVVTSSIAFGATGTVNVWQAGAVTSPVQAIPATFRHVGSGRTLAVNTKVKIHYDVSDGKWVILSADCP
jgi:hypothetical protein